MQAQAHSLPDDIDALKSLFLKQAAENATLGEHNEQLLAENRHVKAQVCSLQEQINLLLAKRFGPSSEQLSPDQIRLFNEAEHAAAETEPVEASASVTIAGHTRSTRGRQPLPEALPRLRVEHELPEAERTCSCGCQLTRIGEEISEQLDIVPAQIRVLQHVRGKYACKGCEQTIRSASLPPQPIPKSLASPGLLAHVTVAKYQDALPLYRQERILQRLGVELPRATLANWMIRAGELIQPLINLMRERLLAYDILQMDETTVQVLKEPGKSAQSKSYLWVQRGGPPEHPLILYDYDPSRGQAVPKRLLEGYQGFLQTDGYEGYNAVVANGAITHLGCWAHVRRKFDEALKTLGKKHPDKGGRATKGLVYIQKLYRIERRVKDAEPQERRRCRNEHARPLLAEIRAWLDAALPEVAPTSATGKALNYLHNEWPKLVRYLEDGRLAIDNNRIENAIRPFVVGRKNWLFSDTVNGVKASASLYSLIESAKANSLEPYAYLRYVFTELPRAETVEAIEALLPGNINNDQISRF
jgi:transposase